MIAVPMLVIALCFASFAVTPRFWEDFTQRDLLKGKFDRLSLTPDAKILAAPAFDQLFDTGQPYIFSMVRDKAGNLYLGTGDGGKVFKVDPQGHGSLCFESKELNVFALALDSADTLYVATSPEGKVYKVTGSSRFTEYCDPESKYIWALAFDKDDNLFVGTGPSGVIHKVDKSGRKYVFYTCNDNHVMSLAKGSNDTLLAGTSPGGLIVEIASEGKGFVLIDTPLQEVRSLALDRAGTIYAVASSAKAAAPDAKTDGSQAAAISVSATVMAVEGIASSENNTKDAKTVTAPGGEKDSQGVKSAIYAIARDGSSETIYSSAEQVVFGAAVREDGSVLAATGPKGRLLSVDTAKQVTVVSDFPEEDLTQLLVAGDVTYLGTSNQGKAYRLRAQRAAEGAYESPELDAGTVASWGKISWSIAGPDRASIALSTRTGNTEKADSTWSGWSAPYTAPGQQVTSPRARYLQWRAAFKIVAGEASHQQPSMLEGVQIAYLQQNLRPQVTAVDVLPAGVELQKQPSMAMGSMTLVAPGTTSDGRSLNSPRERGKERQPLPPRQVLQPGAQSFTWKAVDDNEDALEYSVYFKGEGESDWKLLEKKLTDMFYTLNAAALPDGRYRLKVVASDAASNPYDRYLTGELVTDSFVVANASPEVEIADSNVNGKKVDLRFRARVSTGRIATAEFSIDGGEWFLIFPVDGIADSTLEEYKILTPELSVGEHLIGIRASDGNGTTGTSRLAIKIQ
jgi:sugar lactone lactonase YvrE